jgi:hypothetical protein
VWEPRRLGDVWWSARRHRGEGSAPFLLVGEHFILCNMAIDDFCAAPAKINHVLQMGNAGIVMNMAS